ncbi:MAG: GSU2403 family nucleotidyltransferase fold protein [Deltaproteobacteria bacterium]
MIKAIRQVLRVFADHGLFGEGVELVGSWCFYFYQLKLGARQFPLKTLDVDFLIPNPFKGQEHPDFIRTLETLGFNSDFKSDGSLYLWNSELKIEFLTPDKGRGSDKAIRIRKLGIDAIPLRFIGLLLDKPMLIQDGDFEILVPDPARFCLHKLIVAYRRKNLEKSSKDLQQAICTFSVADCQTVGKIFATLPRKWRAAILTMLQKADSEFPLFKEEIDKLRLILTE